MCETLEPSYHAKNIFKISVHVCDKHVEYTGDTHTYLYVCMYACVCTCDHIKIFYKQPLVFSLIINSI